MATERTPTDAVREWLEREGLPLEMRVRKRLQEAGWQAWQGDVFPGRDSTAPREIDVVGIKQEIGYIEELRQYMELHVFLIAECKYAKAPWVIFTNRARLPGEILFAWLPQRTVGERKLDGFRIRDALGRSPVFASEAGLGYRVQQSKPGNRIVNERGNAADGRDPAYTACMKLAQATRWKVDTFQVIESNISTSAVVVGIPVIVIDGALTEVFLDETDTPVVAEIEQGCIMWKAEAEAAAPIPIYVLRERELPAFAEHIRQLAEMWYKSEVEFWKRVAKLKTKPADDGSGHFSA